MRLIDADKLKRVIVDYYVVMNHRSAIEAIDLQPTIEAEPVKYGKWFEIVERKHDPYTDEYFDELYYNCLECGYASDWKHPYCPNCGARMDK